MSVPDSITPETAEPRRGGPTLSQRAILTLGSSSLQQGVQFLVALVLVPLIIRGLGAELYGAWLVIQQTIGYVAIADLRPSGTLKLTLGRQQHDDDDGYKQRQIGATIIVWLFTFPLIALIGVVIVILAPAFIKVQAADLGLVRIVIALSILDIGMDRLVSLPGVTLRAMNLDYKAMGLNAFTILLEGVLNVLVIWLGYGIVGLAVSGFVGIVIQGLVRFQIARRNLPWFRPKMPTRKEVWEFFSLSLWLFVSSFSYQLMFATDLILVGIQFGPARAAIYATTEAALSLGINAIANLQSAGQPGLIGLIGQGEWKRVEKVRHEMYIVTISMMTILGCGIIILNGSFIQLWVGKEFFGGILLSLLLVITATLTTLYKFDAVIIDGMLMVRNRTFAMIIAGTFSIVMSLVLSPVLGMFGMMVGLIGGRASLLFYTWFILHKKAQMHPLPQSSRLARLLAVSTGLSVISLIVAPHIQLSSWFTFFIVGGLVTATVTIVVWSLGLYQDDRRIIMTRVVIPLQSLWKASRSAT